MLWPEVLCSVTFWQRSCACNCSADRGSSTAVATGDEGQLWQDLFRNQQLMHHLPGSRKRRKREEQETKPWRKLEIKPEWRKRNVRLWETIYDKRRRQDMQFEEFLDYKQKSIRHILGTFSFHFLTQFFLCMCKVIMVNQRLFTSLNCTLILDIHCWYPMYSLRLAPQWFTFTSSNTDFFLHVL